MNNDEGCPIDHSKDHNGSLWDCDHPECVALQRMADGED